MSFTERMICRHCDNSMPIEAKFCVECGREMVAARVESTGRPALRERSVQTVILLALIPLVGIGTGLSLFMNARASALPQEAESPSVTSTTHSSKAAASDPMSPAELSSTYGDAVVRVETFGCGLEGVGTAFAISEHRLITNWHVVLNDVTPVLRLRSGRSITGLVVGWSEDPDIAVIETTEELDTHLGWADTSELSEGDDLSSLGYPLPDHAFSVTPGSVLSFVKEGSKRVAIRTDASVDRGSSGGPALTNDGSVAGVVTQIDLNLEGFQYVPLIVTYDALAGTINRILDEPDRMVSDCDHPFLIEEATWD